MNESAGSCRALARDLLYRSNGQYRPLRPTGRLTMEIEPTLLSVVTTALYYLLTVLDEL
jgi:hypothetical protein